MEIFTARVKEKPRIFPQSRNSRLRQKINREKPLISHNQKSEIAKLISIFIDKFSLPESTKSRRFFLRAEIPDLDKR
ncbi:MAG: hypothetical protein F6K17_08625 [Okeania sp. SIO3C4]|nr:hypothetical protein [Okeania sp. SIO3C4]